MTERAAAHHKRNPRVWHVELRARALPTCASCVASSGAVPSEPRAVPVPQAVTSWSGGASCWPSTSSSTTMALSTERCSTLWRGGGRAHERVIGGCGILQLCREKGDRARERLLCTVLHHPPLNLYYGGRATGAPTRRRDALLCGAEAAGHVSVILGMRECTSLSRARANERFSGFFVGFWIHSPSPTQPMHTESRVWAWRGARGNGGVVGVTIAWSRLCVRARASICAPRAGCLAICYKTIYVYLLYSKVL